MSTIILAEDDSTLRDNLKSFLVHEGFAVLDASNGLAAYSLAVSSHPDLVISDVNMPVSGGIDLLKKLHANPETSGIPLILMTAEAGTEEELKNMACSAKGFLIKPFNLSDLMLLIDRCTSDEGYQKNV